MKIERIGLVGYGEVGKTFATGLLGKLGVAAVHAWDLKFAADTTRRAELDHAARHGITAHESMPSLCAACDLVISAVTASNTLAVAQEAARHIRAGTVFLDLNSASPGTKQQAAALIDAQGARVGEICVGASTGNIITQTWFRRPLTVAGAPPPPPPAYQPSFWERAKQGLNKGATGVRQGVGNTAGWIQRKVTPAPTPPPPPVRYVTPPAR